MSVLINCVVCYKPAVGRAGFVFLVIACMLRLGGCDANAQQLCERVRAGIKPVGAPKASDVTMRSLSVHPRNTQDPHDTMQALRDFHVSTLAWAYITDREIIQQVKASGRAFGGAASAPSYIRPADGDDWFENVVIVNLDGEPIIAPWKRTWKRTLWGCMNNPELERGYVQYLKQYIDAGAQLMQRDEPGGNLNATRWEGCFCKHCMTGFRKYLDANFGPIELHEFGIQDIESFDYQKHLRQAKAPVGDAFDSWDGGTLKNAFIKFQTETTVAFHRHTREALDTHAGRRVPFSCNNGVHRWTEIEHEFDWAFGELSYSRATAHQLYQAMQEAAQHSRGQIVTMPKKGNHDNSAQWQRRTRRTIAMAHACGGHCMVPWDVYMPHDAPRYFGKPEQYADLFGFIRGNTQYFDGYEQAAATGYGVPKSDRPIGEAVRIVGGENAIAIVRALPGQRAAPVVVHLVNWSEEPEPFTITLDPQQFFGDRSWRIRLLQPKPYSEQDHVEAEESGSFLGLTQSTTLAAGRMTSVKIPPLQPWGLLVIEPMEDDRGGVWQPSISAEPESYFSEQMVVSIDTPSRDAVIRYTMDGSDPHQASATYRNPISLTKTTKIKAVAFAEAESSQPTEIAFTKVDGTASPLAPNTGALATSLELWLRADAFTDVLRDGDAVRAWPASAGPAAVVPAAKLYSGLPAAPPTFIRHAINGVAAIRFDGVDDQLAIKDFANDHLAATAFTVFLVTGSDNSGFGICGNSLTGSGGLPRLYLTRGTFRYNDLDRGINLGIPDSMPGISVFSHDGRESISAFINGQSKGRQSGLPTVDAFGGGNLAMPFWGGNKNQSGDIAEIIVFDRALTDAERQGIEAYLAEKYRIQVQRKWR